MKALAFLMAIGLAAAAVAPTPPPAPADCPRYQLFTSGDLMLPSSVPGLVPNVLIFNTNDLMSGQPFGPYFSARSSDCFWVPNGAFSCSLDLFLESFRTTLIGWGTLNSSSLTAQGVTTQPGFHLVGGSMQLTTHITNPSFVAPTPSINFHDLSTTIVFPAQILMPAQPSNAAPVSNGISFIGSTQFLTLWGSNGWNGTTWDSSRTTGADFRASMVCSPPTTTRPPSACPACPEGQRVVPKGCIDAHASIAQTVAGNCISLSFSQSASTASDNGCVSGSF
jgi:hypothetical protein